MFDKYKCYPELLYYRTKVKKMTIAEVTKGLEMSESTYLRVEKGERELTLSEASTIAHNMSLPLSTLFPIFFASDVDKWQQSAN